ncbi:penicillin-binding transpeptidase domain-containing protein [Anaerotignum sp.]|uniref:penicillin-binding transpeptidase domain-containing protein n=1 Tax=Anaerotignum sp. TaxID=2039241 RepID=UPI0028AE9CCC|nr:penicillin-binding transpeptidase domain-containing protein [Anaerotignum sp.]
MMRKSTMGIKAKSKFAFILFVFMAVFVIFLGRVVYLKVVHGEEYEAAAKNQQINRYDSVIAANRGSILDRNEQVLAISTAVYNIVLDPLVLAENKEEEQEKTLTTLCQYFPELDYATLKKYITVNPATGEINLPNHWKYLVKGVDRSLKEELEAMKLKGIYYEQTSKRSYPLNTLGCHLLGFIRGDSHWGVEGQYNDYMVGTPGRSFILYEGGNGVTYQDYPAQDGDTVITTIDYTIQQYAEEVVAETATKWPSDNVAAIVMDPNTGEVLALAESNSFDLNDPGIPLQTETNADFKTAWEAKSSQEQMEYLNNMWKTFSISSTYEPGSIYKPLVAAAALEEGVITPSTTFYCSGSMDVSGTTIRCHLRSGHGTINVEEILAQSCNMGIIQIAQKLGAEKLYRYQMEFGFGQKTGIDLPGEVDAANLLHSLSAIGPTELATISFGQTFNCTTIQIITAFSALINGGNVVKPHVVSQVIDQKGDVVFENKPQVIRQVISTKTSDYMRVALKATVERGTGKKIKIPGYSIGCKTGTAEQGARNRDDLWTLTHMAYFPAENPKYIVLTVINLPEDYADGVQSTAPMTKTLIEKIIKYKNLEPTEGTEEVATLTAKETVEVPDYVGSSTYNVVTDLDSKELNYKVVGTGNTITNQVPKGNTKVEKGSEIILYVEKSAEDSGKISVPNVVGKSYNDATTALTEAGFEVVFEGETDGVVSSQDPKYGVSVEKGGEVKIKLTPKAEETASNTQGN